MSYIPENDRFFLTFPKYLLLMRIGPFLISAVITTGLVYGLNKKWGSIPPVGKFLSPQFGVWQNAEAANKILRQI